MLCGNQRPPLHVSLHVHEVLHFFGRLYVVNTVALDHRISNWLLAAAHRIAILLLVSSVVAGVGFRYKAAGRFPEE